MDIPVVQYQKNPDGSFKTRTVEIPWHKLELSWYRGNGFPADHTDAFVPAFRFTIRGIDLPPELQFDHMLIKQVDFPQLNYTNHDEALVKIQVYIRDDRI